MHRIGRSDARPLACTLRVALAVGALAMAACGGDARTKGGARANEAAQQTDSVAVADTGRTDSLGMEALRARYAGRRLGHTRAEAVPGTRLRATSVPYETPGREDGYGEIVALWSAEDGKLVWAHEHPGDFPPGGLIWLDADRDGETDLFFIAGEEDVFETYLFVNRTHRDPPSPDSAFVLAYRSGNDYTTLLDLDGDGAPELIDSGHSGDEHVDVEACIDQPPPAAFLAEAQREYARRVGTFDAANFKYGHADFAPWTLHLLDPVRILQLRDGRVQDVTTAFGEHVRWRIGVLQGYRDASSGECRAHIDRILTHLRGAAG